MGSGPGRALGDSEGPPASFPTSSLAVTRRARRLGGGGGCRSGAPRGRCARRPRASGAERSGAASAPAEPSRAEPARPQLGARAEAGRGPSARGSRRRPALRLRPGTVARPAATCCVAPRASAFRRGRLRGFGRGPPGARAHGRSLPRTLRTVSLLRFAEPAPSSCARYRGGSKRVGGEAYVGRRPGGAGRPGRERRRPSRARPDVGPGVGQPGRSPLGQVPLGPGVGGAIPAAASWGRAGTGRGEQTRSPKCPKFSFAHFAGLNFEL